MCTVSDFRARMACRCGFVKDRSRSSAAALHRSRRPTWRKLMMLKHFSSVLYCQHRACAAHETAKRCALKFRMRCHLSSSSSLSPSLRRDGSASKLLRDQRRTPPCSASNGEPRGTSMPAIQTYPVAPAAAMCQHLRPLRVSIRGYCMRHGRGSQMLARLAESPSDGGPDRELSAPRARQEPCTKLALEHSRQ